MMNVRERSVLTYIFDYNAVKIESLAQYFGVTERTIRNYCKSIFHFLESISFKDALTLKKNTIVVNCSSKEKEAILTILEANDYYCYKLSPEERRFIIALSLLMAGDEFITINDFENRLSSSRITIYNDIKIVSKFFEQHDIKYKENKHSGFVLDTDEEHIRLAIYSLIKDEQLIIEDIFENVNKKISVCYINNCLNLNLFHKISETSLSIVEKHCGLSFDDSSFYDVVLMISIMLSRIKSTKYIENIDCNINKKSLTYKSAYKIIDYVCDFNKNEETIYKNEVGFLCKFLTNYNLNNIKNDNNNLIDVYVIVKGFLCKLTSVFGVDFLGDAKLQDFLTAHIIELLKRIQCNKSINNTFKNDMISKYEKEYYIVHNCLYILEDNLHVKINVNEEIYILMHIMAAVHRIESNTIVPRVIVCCHSGFSTSQFLAESLKKNFLLEIVDFKSARELKTSFTTKKENISSVCDLIVTTVSLDDFSFPYVKVNPILDDSDIVKVGNILDEIRPHLPKKQTLTSETNSCSTSKNKYKLNNIFSKDLISINNEAKDWKEAIVVSCQPLINKGVVEPKYIKGIINNVIMNGPYFVLQKHVAFAHATINDGVKKFGFSLSRFEDGVVFGKKDFDPVKIIVVISSNQPSVQMKYLFNILSEFCREDSFEKLMDAKTIDEIYELILTFDKS